MYLKKKDEHKMSSGLVAQTAGSAVCGFPTITGTSRYTNSTEQSQNVYENKGEGQKVSRKVEKSKSRIVEKQVMAASSPPAGRKQAFRLFDSSPSRFFTSEPGMSMKIKERHKRLTKEL